MSAPNLSPDVTARVDQEHAGVRDVLDQSRTILDSLSIDAWPAMFGRLIVIDCLCFARDPERMMYRLAAWDRVCLEYGG